MMKGILQFLKATLVGGILFLVPVILLVIIVGKALEIARKIVDPLAARVPVESVIGLETPKLLAIALLVLLCFFAGLFARTAPARRGVRWLEAAVLSNVPGYEFIKSTFAITVGAESEHSQEVVLVQMEDAWQFAFVIERLEHGNVAVFVPGAPNPQSGSLYFMAEDRIKSLDISSTSALKCLRRLGVGSNVLLREFPNP